MKALLVTAAAATLIWGGALAADDHHDKAGPNKGGHQTTQPITNRSHDATPDTKPSGGAKNDRKPSWNPGPSNTGGAPSGNMSHGYNNKGGDRHDTNRDNGGTKSGNPLWNSLNHAGDNRGNNHGKVDVHNYRRNFSAAHRYHAGDCHAPHGYRYRRWTYGHFLPSLFFGENYWINDYDDYALDDPPDGAVWVRYGNDAILVDQYTGQVIQVAYGVFY